MRNSNLTKYESKTVSNFIEDSTHPKVRNVHKAYSNRVRAALRNKYDKMPYLTVAETSIWLDKHPDTIYRFIKNGYIVAIRFGGPSSNWLVDVEATKKNLYV